MALKQVDVAASVDAVLQNVVALIQEIKAKQTLPQILAEELATLPALIGAIVQIKGDLADPQSVINAAALGAAGILEELLK